MAHGNWTHSNLSNKATFCDEFENNIDNSDKFEKKNPNVFILRNWSTHN